MSAVGPSRPTSAAYSVGLRRKPTFECRCQHSLASKNKPAHPAGRNPDRIIAMPVHYRHSLGLIE
jgi:hypothetical protein